MHEVDISVVAKLFVQTGKTITAQSIRDATDRVAGNMERGLVTYLHGEEPMATPEEAARWFSIYVRKVMSETGLEP